MFYFTACETFRALASLVAVELWLSSSCIYSIFVSLGVQQPHEMGFDLALAQLLEMGFDPALARMALQESAGQIGTAIDRCLNMQYQ